MSKQLTPDEVQNIKNEWEDIRKEQQMSNDDEWMEQFIYFLHRRFFDVAAPDDQIEALARVLRDAYTNVGLVTVEYEQSQFRPNWRNVARAAVDFMRVGPPAAIAELAKAKRALERAGFVDNEAQEWKPPLGPSPRFVTVGPTRAEAEAKWQELTENETCLLKGSPEFKDWLLPLLSEGALEPAQKCLSCGAPRHTGKACTYCSPKPPESIASPDTLETLAEIGKKAYGTPGTRWADIAAAILRAAQAYIPTEGEGFMLPNGTGFDEEEIQFLNSHIRYRVAPTASQSIEGLPSADELVDLLQDEYRKINEIPQPEDIVEIILTALRPWLRDPAGWELDVTASELYKVWKSMPILPFKAILDLCRSRIRPVFECKECVKAKAERDVMYRDWDDCRNRMLKVRLALNEGSES